MRYGGYGSYQMPNGSYGSSPYQTQDMGGYGLSSYASAQANQVEIVTVTLYDNYFRPKTITVSAGTTVQWRNAGRHSHTVTSDRNGWDSGELYPGEVFSYTFNRPGTYAYHCAVHPDEMRGAVVVKGTPGDQGSRSLSSYPTAKANKLPRVPTNDDIEVSGPLDTPPPHRAIIRLRLPQTWADVFIDGRKIDVVGRLRTYVTPELPRARTFEVAATWKRNGRTHRMEDKVTLEAGQVRTLDFTSEK
jgi:uncharacterized protein (TIGR03000 family)